MMNMDISKAKIYIWTCFLFSKQKPWCHAAHCTMGLICLKYYQLVDLSNLRTFPSLWFITGNQQGLCVNLDRPVRSIHENRMKKDCPKIARQESGKKRDVDLSKDGDFFNERVACWGLQGNYVPRYPRFVATCFIKCSWLYNKMIFKEKITYIAMCFFQGGTDWPCWRGVAHWCVTIWVWQSLSHWEIIINIESQYPIHWMFK